MKIPVRFLYLGAAGEHYVMSECYRGNMEAFKLPIDKGFDLAVTTAYMHFKAAEDRKSQPIAEAPTYLQVKSSLAAPMNENRKAGERPRWGGRFSVKLSELDLICETANSALACVAFFESVSDLSLARTTFAWWTSSATVKELHLSGHFIKNDEDTLALNYEIVGEAIDSTSKQNTYVRLLRQNKSKDAAPGDLTSGSLVEKDCFYFGKLRPQAPKMSSK